MDLYKAIHTRRSIRKYKDQEVDRETIKRILAAAMSAPSSGNEQPWHFIVITEKKILEQVPSINPYAGMAKDAPCAVLVCGDLSKENFPGNWMLDCAAAVQNMLLAIHAEGLGGVWTGIYPEYDRIEGFRELFSLPLNIVPFALVPLGYPDQELKPEIRYMDSRIHFEHWLGRV